MATMKMMRFVRFTFADFSATLTTFENSIKNNSSQFIEMKNQQL